MEVDIARAIQSLDADDRGTIDNVIELAAIGVVGYHNPRVGLMYPVLNGFWTKSREQGLIDSTQPPGCQDGHQQLGDSG
ncbi:hypothetical protein D3C77_495180 [compost metagenome]